MSIMELVILSNDFNEQQLSLFLSSAEFLTATFLTTQANVHAELLAKGINSNVDTEFDLLRRIDENKGQGKSYLVLSTLKNQIVLR